MSLANFALNQPVSNAVAGNPRKFTATTADIVAGGAFTTVDVKWNLPEGAVLNSARIKHSEAVAGATGPIMTSTARLFFNGTALGSGTLDVFAAPGSTAGTHYITDITGNGAGKVDDVNVLLMRITETGATTGLSDVTAGSIDAWVDYSIMAP